jgi:hypothetical protein
MLFDEIPIASFVDLLSSGKVHTLRLKEDFRVVFVSGKGLEVTGVHTLPPIGMSNSLQIANGSLFGQTYDAWRYWQYLSDEAYQHTSKRLKALNVSLAQHGQEALGVLYSRGPKVLASFNETIPLNTFCIPTFAASRARETLTALNGDLHESLLPEWTHDAQAFLECWKLTTSRVPGVFGVKEIEFDSQASGVCSSLITESTEDVVNSRDGLRAALLENDEHTWKQSATQLLLKKYGVTINFSGFLPSLDHSVVEEVLINRLTMLNRCELPNFYQSLFYRKAGTSLGPSGYDNLRWICRNYADLWSKADALVQDYKRKALSRSQWCGVDQFAGVLPTPTFVPTFNKVALRKMGLELWPYD